MLNELKMLSDEQMRQFLTYGFLKLNTDFPESFHNAILNRIQDVYASEGNSGNNLLPRIPEIGQIFEDPTIRGALSSILGSDYIMSSHRHGHLTKKENGHVYWHKDNYWMNEKIRNHRPWSALIFYYTQDVTEDMGPSTIMPGTQNYYEWFGDNSNSSLSVCGKAGTLVLIDYDLWHTATPNLSQIDRFMFKFQFFRMEAPKQPAWDNRNSQWVPPADISGINEHSLQWQSVWKWLSGRAGKEGPSKTHEWVSVDLQGHLQAFRNDAGSSDWQIKLKAADDIGQIGSVVADEAIPDLTRLLHDPNEAVTLNAAYALAAMGEKAVPSLIEGLNASSHSIACNAAHGLIELGSASIPALLDVLEGGGSNGKARGYAAFALSELGSDASVAVPALIALLQDEAIFVRQHAVEALGLIQIPASETVPALCEALQDSHDFIRFTAGLALARLGPLAEKAVPALQLALTDHYRYVPSIAVDALDRIQTVEAMKVMVPFLKQARWCPITTQFSTY